jgi:folate-binding protein YgfZ
MPTTQFTHLDDRGVIRAAGTDAATLLDGLLTNSIDRLDDHGAIHTGLLSPQGKILFDFFLFKSANAFLIDIDRTMADDLIKRLTFYRLRADVTFENISDTYCVAALWPAGLTIPGGILSALDPRNRELGLRFILPSSRLPEIAASQVGPDIYHSHRISLGVPDAGQDYPLFDTFPHEALYDQLHSINFKKGCFVGQEVVSRMQHRGTARKRAMRVTTSAPIQSGTSIEAGEATIGKIGSVSGTTAIAMVRLDRASEASARGTTLQAGDIPITITPPDWIKFDIATGKPAADT